MKKLKIRFTIVFAMLAATLAAAAQTTFRLLQPQNVVEGRRFTITYRLSNGDANAPAAPELDGCRLFAGPSVSTMQSMQIINGQASSTYTIDFSYTYVAEKAGTVKVPALTVSSGGKQYSSGTASFQILPPDRAATNNRQGQQGHGNVHADDITTQSPARVSADDLMVRVSFSKSQVYEQEAVIATIKVYTKYNITSFLVTTQPAFEGFLSEELPTPLQMQLENYNGQNYHTAVLKRCLLYPQKSGKLTVNTGKYDVTIEQYETVNMGFFRTQRPVERQVTTSSNAATLTVLPLPEPRPAGFDGAVGSFTIDSELNPELLRTNEAATYSLIIKGTGNIKYLKEPTVDFPSVMDRFTPKPEIDTRVSGSNTTGTYRVDYTIVPQEVGSFTIPATPFVYFNPSTKKYETLTTKAYDVKVVKGTSSTVTVEQKDIDRTVHDIRHIRTSSDTPEPIPDRVFYRAYYWIAYAVAIAMLLTFILLYRRSIKQAADVRGRKLARAGREANKRLKAARSYLKARNSERFYDSLAQAMRGYVSDKLGIAPSQLIRDNIGRELSAYGASDEHINAVLDVLDQCEMARFTPEHSDSEMNSLLDNAVTAINNLEAVKKR